MSVVASDIVESSASARIESAWAALRGIEDPEIPAVSIVELGLVRHVNAAPGGALEVGLSPTYVGCPATEVIRRLVGEALEKAGVGDVSVKTMLSPPWSSDWITPEGRRKLHAYGIVPPDRRVSSLREVVRSAAPIACPHCGSRDTETVSEFGSTPCKALHRCRACLEPFEYFKCI